MLVFSLGHHRLCTGLSSSLEGSTETDVVKFLKDFLFCKDDCIYLITETGQEEGGLGYSASFPTGFELIFVKPHWQPLYNPGTTGTFIYDVAKP